MACVLPVADEEVGGMQMCLYTTVPGSCRVLSRVLTRGMWRFGLPERGDGR
jgi:hypothetical protein